MNAAVAGKARLLHRLPGRIRLHLPGETGERQRCLAELRRLPGVTSVHDNPWTSNLLIHFDPLVTDQGTLLEILTITDERPEGQARLSIALPLLRERPAERHSAEPLQAAL